MQGIYASGKPEKGRGKCGTGKSQKRSQENFVCFNVLGYL